MNAKDIEDMKDVKTVIDQMETNLESVSKGVDNLLVCLMGDPKDRHDLGLVGDVKNNKQWKNLVNKWLGIVGISTFGLLLKEGFNFFKRG